MQGCILVPDITGEDDNTPEQSSCVLCAWDAHQFRLRRKQLPRARKFAPVMRRTLLPVATVSAEPFRVSAENTHTLIRRTFVLFICRATCCVGRSQAQLTLGSPCSGSCSLGVDSVGAWPGARVLGVVRPPVKSRGQERHHARQAGRDALTEIRPTISAPCPGAYVVLQRA